MAPQEVLVSLGFCGPLSTVTSAGEALLHEHNEACYSRTVRGHFVKLTEPFHAGRHDDHLVTETPEARQPLHPRASY